MTCLTITIAPGSLAGGSGRMTTTNSNIPTLWLIDQPDGIEATVSALPTPPEGLGEAGEDLWISMISTFNFHGEPGKLTIPERACGTVDTIAELEEAQ